MDAGTSVDITPPALAAKSKATLQWREFASGCGAACFNMTVTYPLYKITYRQILHGVKPVSAFSQLRQEGIFYLYRGMAPPLIQRMICYSLMFGIYDAVRRPLVDDYKMNPYYATFYGGMASGMFEAALIPLERVESLLQNSTYHHHFKNTYQAFRYILKHYGVKELFRGRTPILLRNGPLNVVYFTLREAAEKRIVRKENPVLHVLQEFISGACIGVLLSVLFFPTTVTKIALQKTLGTSHESMISVVRRLYIERDRSIVKWYSGLGITTLRATMSWGVMNSAYYLLRNVVLTG